MHRLFFGLAPALLLMLMACGGGSETVPADSATAAATAALTGGDVTAAPTGDGSTSIVLAVTS